MKRKLYTIGLIALIFCFSSFKSLNAQQALNVSSSERFIAYSLYNFSKLIKWPTSGTTNKFQVAVVGDEKVFRELQNLAKNKKVGNANYDIVFYRDIREVTKYCHMVYLSNYQSGKISQLPQNRDVLIVTERDGMSRKGSTISFTTDSQGKMGFEIAKDNAAKNQLTIHMQLERMAISVM